MSHNPYAISPQPLAMDTKQSARLFARAQAILPGGVDSPVRAFKSVGAAPLFIQRAVGSRIQDIDGNTFVDYVMSWGPLIHGHEPKGLVKALAAAAKDGTSFGAPSPLEVALGERVRALMPSLERVRFVSSGTEAAMSALRVARAATGRDRVLKFEGCYHGHADAFLVKAGSGALTLGTPTSPGVTRGTSADTLVAAYNHLDSVRQLFDANRGQIAAVIVEPIAGNMGLVPPADGFLSGLRELTRAAGAARDAGVALQVNAFGSLLTPFFTGRPVRDFASATSADTDRYAVFFRGMLQRGVYPPPSQFEAWFLSAAHTSRDVNRTIRAARDAMKEVTKVLI